MIVLQDENVKKVISLGLVEKTVVLMALTSSKTLNFSVPFCLNKTEGWGSTDDQEMRIQDFR